MENAALGPMWL